MKDETSSVVRVKLNITHASATDDVRNVWMSLNYNQKPTIAHMIEHIKKNYLNSKEKCAELVTADEDSVKMFMDDYWLPPYENSRLLRENDCVKIVISTDATTESGKKKAEPNKEPTTATSATTKYTKNLAKKNLNDDASATATTTTVVDKLYNKQLLSDAAATATNCYHNYYNNSMYEPSLAAATYTAAYSLDPLPSSHKPDAQFPEYQYAYNLYKANEVKKTNDDKPDKSQPPTVTAEPKKSNKPAEAAKPKPEPTNKKPSTAACYKKFSIGNYAHLLNEPVVPPTETESISGEQIIDKYYNTLKSKTREVKAAAKVVAPTETAAKKGTEKTTTTTELTASDVGKIAATIVSHGKAKWKNSGKPTATGGESSSTTSSSQPKHIRFSSSSESSSSSDSSSSSSSGSESSSDEEVEVKPTKMSTTTVAAAKKTDGAAVKVANKWYEPTKEEQLAAESNNRSFVVQVRDVLQNPKEMNEFKKAFNQTKMTAPKKEKHNSDEPKTLLNKSHSNQNLNNENAKPTAANTGANKSKSTPASAEKRSKQQTANKQPAEPQSPPRSPKRINYEQFEALNGPPRLSDKLAFQLLEISENFTPEISEYKTGRVVDFDASTNEVTLKLHSKVSSVLERPSKFSVVLDEMTNLKNAESDLLNESQTSEYDENLLKADWRNLINVKLLRNDFFP